MLTQFDDDGWEFVLAYVNRSNNKMKAKYSSYEGECFAVVWVVSSFQCYLYGSLGDRSPTFEIPYGTILTHRKVG